MSTKRVAIQLPKQAQNQVMSQRWALELEGLGKTAELVEVRADTPAEFAAGVADVDGIITSWGLRIDAQVISAMKKCVVIGVGSVGVDMVDIEAATEAGIVVTNVPDVFIEEVADHAMALTLALYRQLFPLDAEAKRQRRSRAYVLSQAVRLMRALYQELEDRRAP